MPDPIPASDPALLAAQAKGGQAGVDAYNAAIASMQQQRAQAVQQAMQEAALRGAPVGAAQSLQSTITNPYDQGIAQLTQGNAAFQGDMAARNQRYQDYQGGVQAARSFIPLQTEQTLAPIRAENDFRLRTQQIAGDRAIGEIDADTKLQLAKIAATRQAAEIAAAKKAASDAAKKMQLNQGELTSLMSQGAAGLINEKLGGVSSAIAANEAALGKQFGQTATSTAATYGAAQRGQSQLRNQSYWDLMGAAYTGKAIQEDKGKQAQLAKEAERNATRDVVTQTAAGATPPGLPSIPSVYDDMGTVMPGGPPPVVPRPTMPSGTAVPVQASQPRDYTSAEEQVRQLVARAAQARANVGKFSPGADFSTNFGGAWLQQLLAGLADQYSAGSSVNAAGQRILMTPEQVQGLDPFSYSAVMGSKQPIRGVESFNRNIMGETAAPGSYYDTGGVANQYSAEVMRTALAQSAQSLRDQGYDIDLPQVADAMPEATSIHDFLAGQGAGQTNEDIYRKAQAQGTQGEKATVAQAQQWLAANGYGRNVPASVGDAVDLYNMLNDPQSGGAVDSAEQLVTDAIQRWGVKDGDEPAIPDSFDDKGKVVPLNRDRLREVLRRAGVPSQLWDVALMRSGY